MELTCYGIKTSLLNAVLNSLQCFAIINDAPAPESNRAFNMTVSDPFFIDTNMIGTNGSSIVFVSGIREPATLHALTTLVLEKDKQ